MSPREQPQYVGVEEHWKDLCECKANKHCLLYRHSLAELNNLILNAAGRGDYTEATQNKIYRNSNSICLILVHCQKRIKEREILLQIVEKTELCRTRLTEVADRVLAHVDKDLDVVAEKLSTALKAVEAAGVYDHDSKCKFEMALARNSWRVRAQKLLESSLKPTVQQIQRHLKEGSAISIPLKDYFRETLIEVKHRSVQWVDTAKKVLVDSGELELDKVYDLIMEGNDLLVEVEKELKLLQDRSMLYCICRKPYDQRAMIACDKWYHFDCIKLTSPPKVYTCPACKLDNEYLSSSLSSSQERIFAETTEGGTITWHEER
ncbi:chromatin modification-related protein YNG2 isoform X3 [Daucus carota subsp. sativus]|uniref:chromatin modification-related protein YNG2 isoform X3 n=1 Tax=Daucus carota subsp. sativus TaxID=79200 RepID=UPI00308304BC